jgi:hypothetical protein
MFTRMSSTVFHTAVVLTAAAVTVWLNMTGHSFHIAGLLLEMWAILVAVLFGLRLADGFRPDRLSIWVGPVSSVRPAGPTRNVGRGQLLPEAA